MVAFVKAIADTNINMKYEFIAPAFEFTNVTVYIEDRTDSFKTRAAGEYLINFAI